MPYRVGVVKLAALKGSRDRFNIITRERICMHHTKMAQICMQKLQYAPKNYQIVQKHAIILTHLYSLDRTGCNIKLFRNLDTKNFSLRFLSHPLCEECNTLCTHMRAFMHREREKQRSVQIRIAS
jgi:hypothetical protein